ncbi:c292cd83-8cd3-41d6-9375-be5ac8ab7207 [Thermothielavioides terrestris]|uniref:C292cd83-8cd3-41d6-9375-be5ac8ab7207 n=1 Tax=Thermothielavioides terrestris TaxID=2587410 RepID=A0A446B8P4_9PEZI|nr:c292cd83-8cd3-41d6-9375-be5ac8ab7207 [Thermothielavioides terrestris]
MGCVGRYISVATRPKS